MASGGIIVQLGYNRTVGSFSMTVDGFEKLKLNQNTEWYFSLPVNQALNHTWWLKVIVSKSFLETLKYTRLSCLVSI